MVELKLFFTLKLKKNNNKGKRDRLFICRRDEREETPITDLDIFLAVSGWLDLTFAVCSIHNQSLGIFFSLFCAI